MPRITLPDGARRVAMDGSNRYTGGPGDTVRVSDTHAAAIRKFASRTPRGDRFAFGTRAGRWCAGCARLWNAWSAACPKCGADTTEIPERTAT